MKVRPLLDRAAGFVCDVGACRERALVELSDPEVEMRPYLLCYKHALFTASAVQKAVDDVRAFERHSGECAHVWDGGLGKCHKCGEKR